MKTPKVKPFDLNRWIVRQIKWSKKTFGPPHKHSYMGIIDHIKSELEEIEAEPFELEEYIDVIILALDGAWRTTYQRYPDSEPEGIAGMISSMLEYKFKKNTHREWPDWRTQPRDKAIGHIKKSFEEMPDNSSLGKLLTAHPSELVHYPPYEPKDSKDYDVCS